MFVAFVLAACIGCGAVYRQPKATDSLRATEGPHEARTATIFSPPARGLPLPELPPATSSALSPPSVDPTQPPTDAPLDLDEAIRIGLANSGVVRVLDGGAVSVSSATPFDPHLADARLRAALAAFDPSLSATLYGNWINQPPEAIFGPGLSEPTRRNEAGLNAALVKPWTTGAETRLAYNPPLGYLYLPDGSTSFNPLYSSNLEFALRQPLLKGVGTAVNKAPIRVAQLRRDDAVWQTKQATMGLVRSICEAYWDLHAALAAWRAAENVLPLLDRVVYIEEERMHAQRSVRADVAKTRSQLLVVRQQAVQARSEAEQRELRLRNLLGLPPVDGFRIVPTTLPQSAPVVIDAVGSTATAWERRPDLMRQRLAVRVREQELLVAKNAGLPQVDAVGLYRWNGVGDRLDDSVNQMFGTQYSDWQAALNLSVPLGRRAAAAGIRTATLQLARDRAMLQQTTHAAAHQIQSLAREAEYNYELYAQAEDRVKANAEWLEGAKIRYENPPPGGDDWLLAATNDYLTALRAQADAASDAQKFLARYNTLLARLNEATGAILDDCDICWLPGNELEQCDRVSAVGRAGADSQFASLNSSASAIRQTLNE